MAKEAYLQFIASFIIALVLTIPLYTTSVYAGINKVGAKGSDGIDGFIRATDFVNFEVEAGISGSSITNEQVKLGNQFAFDKCEPLPSGDFGCTLRYPSSGKDEFETTSIPYSVSLLNNQGTIDDSEAGTITVDSEAPVVRLSVSQGQFSSQDSILINYDAADSACSDPSCEDKCVGLKRIDFASGDNSFKVSEEITSEDCSVQSSITIDAKSLKEGKNSILAKAVDKFGHVSPAAFVNFAVDTSGPSILKDSFAITRNGISLDTFSNIINPVDITVGIASGDLDPESVVADLSELNPAPELKDAKAQCTQAEDDKYSCAWSIDLRPSSPGAKTIVVEALDTLGNKGSAAISKSLILDNQGPVVISLATTSQSTNQVLARPSGNTVVAVFDELTGMSADNAYLHIGSAALQAAKCTKDADWTCTWENIDLNDGALISIQSDTTDALGNPVSENKDVKVVVDSEPPVLKSLEMVPIGGIIQAFPNIFKIGDKIAVAANLTEVNDVTATADFSKFIADSAKAIGSCKRTKGNEHTCTFVSDTLNLADSGSAVFDFRDAAGNSLAVTLPLTVLALDEGAVPDYWSNSVSCSPKAIDRQLGPFINERVYCQVKLNKKSSQRVSTVFIGQASCSGDTSLVQSVDTFNAETGSTTPIIRITLKKSEFRIDDASLSCSFNVFSKIGGSNIVTKNPEIENANIKLEFSNLPLGELSDEVQGKIDDAKNDVKGIWEVVGKLNKLVKFATRICQFFHTIFTIAAVLYFVTMKLQISEKTCRASGILNAFGVCEVFFGARASTCGATEATNQAAEAAQTGAKAATSAQQAATTAQKTGKTASLGGGIQKFCDYVTCRRTLWGGKIEEWINTLPLADRIGKTLDGKSTFIDYPSDTTIGTGREGRPLSTYLDPRNSIFVAVLYGCVPGIITNLDKYRQIKCLYADCLETAVGRDGLPVTACEEQKAYATCKYVTGEVFAVIPYTAFIDHFAGLVKEAFSNPFTAIGVGLSVYCAYLCHEPVGFGYSLCRGARLFTLLGDAAQNIQAMYDNLHGWSQINRDYCEKLDLDDSGEYVAAA